MLTYSFNEMYTIAKTNNKNYNGKFFLAVKTTRIFCIPSCKAKIPLLKNVEFFETKNEAIQAGYRGCKRCHSAKWPFAEPDWIQEIISYMKRNLDRKVTEKELADLANVDPTTLRRYFKKSQNVSLMDYFRTLRLENSKELLSEKTVTEVAQLTGFNSVKGFSNAFEKKFGIKPSQVVKNKTTEEEQ